MHPGDRRRDVGKYRSAEEYLVDAASVDMADTAGNLRDGVHVASAGGTWMALVYGFAGYRWRARASLRCSPPEPAACGFPCASVVRCSTWTSNHGSVTYSVRKGGAAIAACHYDTEFTVEPGSPATFPATYRTNDAATVADS